MISSDMQSSIDEMNSAERDAMGSSTPGRQAQFHAAMSAHARSTGVPDSLSVVAPDGLFFVVQRNDGSHGYTRASNFHVRDSKLVTSAGETILGYPAGKSAGPLTPVTLPGNVQSGWTRIAADGTVTIADPRAVEVLDAGPAGGRAVSSAATPQEQADAARLLDQTVQAGLPSQRSLRAGEAGGSASPALGKPVARLVLAQFATATVVDNEGNASSGAPIRIVVPAARGARALKTNSRDLGNIDTISAIDAISDAGARLNAVMADEQARQNRAKAAMDLIK